MTTDPLPSQQITLEDIKGRAGEYLMKAIHEEVTQQRIPWAAMPQQQQQETIERIRSKADTVVSLVVNSIAHQGIAFVPVIIEKMTIKDEAKAVIIMAKGTESMHTFAERIGGKALVVFADPEEFAGNMDAIKAQADQPGLDLED